MTAGVVAAALVLLGAALSRLAVSRARAGRLRARLDGAARRVELPPAPAWAARALARAGVEVPAAPAFAAATGGVAVLALAAAAAGGPALALLAVAAAGVAGALLLRVAAARSARRDEDSLPLALDLVARSLRSGASLPQAVAEASGAVGGGLRADLAAIADQARLGVPFVVAVEAWADRRATPSTRLAAAALCLGAEAGGPRGRAVDAVAATLRERHAVAAEVRALTSQARASAAVIGVAPLLFCAAMVATDDASARFLLRTPGGLAVLLAGLALDAVSFAWMRRLTTRVIG